MRVYKVQHHDSPIRIARSLTGNSELWKELIMANPGKARDSSGMSFASLTPGEYLYVPGSWLPLISSDAIEMGVVSGTDITITPPKMKEVSKVESRKEEEEDSGAWQTPSWEEP